MDDLPFQFLSSFIAITIPLIFVGFMLGKSDARRIILYFCWGTFAGILAYNLNNYFGSTWEQAERMTTSIAPMIEEICKGLPVLLFLTRKKPPQITTLIVICAMASGIGFSVQESMYYFAASPREIGDIATLVIRTLTTALMHGMTTAAFGIGLMVLAQKQRHTLIPLIFGLLAFCASTHALFNLLLQTRFAVIGVTMPIAMFFAGWVFLQSIKQNE